MQINPAVGKQQKKRNTFHQENKSQFEQYKNALFGEFLNDAISIS